MSNRVCREASALVYPDPGRVSADLFDKTRPFFLAGEKVQVKYL